MELLPTPLLQAEHGNLEVLIDTVLLIKKPFSHLLLNLFLSQLFASELISFPLSPSCIQAAQNHEYKEVPSHPLQLCPSPVQTKEG